MKFTITYPIISRYGMRFDRLTNWIRGRYYGFNIRIYRGTVCLALHFPA